MRETETDRGVARLSRREKEVARLEGDGEGGQLT